MLDPDIRKKLMPQIKMRIPKTQWKYIDEMLTEVYLVKYSDSEVLSIKPVPVNIDEARDLSLQFNPITGTFNGIDFWRIVKKKGELIS